MQAASFAISIDWRTTFPGPVRVVTKSPSPPKSAVVIPCQRNIVVDGVIKADNKARLDFYDFTGLQGHFDDVPAAVEEYGTVGFIRCRMILRHPTAVNFSVNAISIFMVSSQQRNEFSGQ